MKRRLLACIVLTFAQAPLWGQNCPTKPAERPFRQVISSLNDRFEWYSAYAQEPDPRYGTDFERHVQNLGKGLLKYEWPLGGLYNLHLQPGHADRACISYGRINPERGPLFYGRMNDSTDTSVWKGEGEPSARNVGLFTSNFVEKGDDPEVQIVLESTFDGHAYSYSLKNTGPTSVRAAWHHFEVDLFERLTVSESVKVEVKRGGQMIQSVESPPERHSEDALRELLKRAKTLEPGQTIAARKESTASAQLIMTNVDIGSIEGQPLAGVALPILVPRQ